MAHHPAAENHSLPSAQASLGSIFPRHELRLPLAELLQLAIQIRNCLLRHNKTRGMSAIQYSGVCRLRCISRQVWAEIIRLVARKGALRVIPPGLRAVRALPRHLIKDFFMAIFHLSAKPPIARSTGQSATAAAAYRAGIIILDERTGCLHDYSSKRGVLSSALLLPGGAKLTDRAGFWNGVEIHHRRGDAVLAREIIVALPDELDALQRRLLAEALGREIAQRFRVAVDISVHAPSRHGDQRNHHAHLLQTACLVEPGGALGKKAVELDPIHCSRAKIEDAVKWLRPKWETLVNSALAEAGAGGRVDHRSNLARGIETLPTIHEGVGEGMPGRKRANVARKKLNSEAAAIGVEVASLLRERALVEAAAKSAAAEVLAQADAAAAPQFVEPKANRSAVRTAGSARLTEAELRGRRDQDSLALTNQRLDEGRRQRIADLTRRRSDALKNSAELTGSLRRAVPLETVRQALADLPSARERAASAKGAAAKLQLDIQAHRWWRTWTRLSTLTEQHQVAECQAQRLAQELVEVERELRAPVFEVVCTQQRALAATLRDLDFELGHLDNMIEGLTKGEASMGRPTIAPVTGNPSSSERVVGARRR